jgi:putative membrane protein insertion efficiency factor
MSRTLTQAAALRAVQAYKIVISPWLPAACRFTPTCSEYAFEAIEQYGFFRGMARAGARLLRCHPLHRGGPDPLI